MRPNIKLDWRSYFYNFVEEHGEPVVLGGKFLFRDGHQYGTNSYQGPEYPPPEDKTRLRNLQIEYWERYRAKLEDELGDIKQVKNRLEGWQKHRSMPLMQIVTYETRDDEGRTKKTKSEPEKLDLTSVESGILDLERLIAECDDQLNKLKEAKNDRHATSR